MPHPDSGNPIGVFDSGVGGLTVVRALMERLPFENIVYFGDTARVPYGVKSVETIAHYTTQIAEFLLAKRVKLLVVACNTMAAVASQSVKDLSPVPVLDVIDAGALGAIATTTKKQVGVIGTPTTINSNAYARAIHQREPEMRIFSQACPLFVPLVEEGWLDHPVTRLTAQEYLKPVLAQNIDTLVLGCTHYPLLRHLIQPRIGRRVAVIDSSQAVALRLQEYLGGHPDLARSLSKTGRHRHYVSDVTPAAQDTANRIFERQVELIKVDDFG